MNLDKTFRIGVDWLTLYDFKISFNKNYVAERMTDEFYQEKFFLDEPNYTIDITNRLYADGQETSFKSLRFNPNKILHGHNISNSREQEIKESLEFLKKDLEKKGVVLNLTGARVKEIEININIPKSFDDLKETLELLFLNVPHLKKISGFTGEKSYKDLFEDESIYGNFRNILVTAYNKEKESDLELTTPVTRLEWRFIKKTFHYFAKTKKLDNKLQTILDNFFIVDEIFLHHTKEKLFKKSVYHIENVIKKNLERDYLAFKKNNKLIKNLGKKEIRGVYSYLEETSWIFDYSFLIEIVSKHDKAHKGREIKTIETKFSKHNNLKFLNYLLEFIFNH